MRLTVQEFILTTVVSFFKKHWEAIVTGFIVLIASIFGTKKIMQRRYEKEQMKIKEAIRKLVAERDLLDASDKKNKRALERANKLITDYQERLIVVEGKLAELA